MACSPRAVGPRDGEYTLTQADVDAGTVVNDASVLGVSDAAVTVDDADVATVAVTPTPAIVLDKTVDRTASAGPRTTLYSFVVRNAGSVTLHDVASPTTCRGCPRSATGRGRRRWAFSRRANR
jgi:hypothetical protein